MASPNAAIDTAAARTLATRTLRRTHYRDNVRYVFAATADLYYAYWGEFLHFAVFEPGEDEQDYDRALERTHHRYFEAINGPLAHRILELATGAGAFAAWMAERTAAEVVGMDLSDAQLAYAQRRLARTGLRNLRFAEHDIMRLHEFKERCFDAAVCLDAACYLPDKPRALRSIATRLTPGAKFLLVDWCRPERVTPFQEKLLLEPFYRLWGIPEMATVREYELGFAAAGFHLRSWEDLSDRVTPNWDRAYRLAQRAVAEAPAPLQLLGVAARAIGLGAHALDLLEKQFYAALLARSSADAGLIRYVSFLAERD